ncbi:MAG: hypothetical protein LUE29_00080 [Lachnospiraceae bacterium]|nr:hypothetical protein [Lachnospiraceae bacterium]
MNNIKKFFKDRKVKAFFLQVLGPLAVFIVAIFIMYELLLMGENYMDETINEVKIALGEDGELSISLDGTRDDIYILWETDGGSVTPLVEDEDFSHIDDSYHYICYTYCDDGIRWDPLDATGDEFELATVRATIYYITEGQTKDYIKTNSDNVEMQLTITLRVDEDGTVTEVEDEDHYFSNPQKKGVSDTWSEIYVVSQDEDGITLRYRTNADIVVESDDTAYVLIWENEDGLISETDLASGIFPVAGISEEEDENHVCYIRQSDMVTVLWRDLETLTDASGSAYTEVKAYLVDQSIYENETFTEEQKFQEAVTGVSVTQAAVKSNDNSLKASCES